MAKNFLSSPVFKNIGVNLGLFGPASGGAGDAQFRAMAIADLPALPFVWVVKTANQSINNGVDTIIDFEADEEDSSGLHATTSGSLTGTVSKTSGQNTLSGSGTSFTTELVVGQLIEVPGGATERRIVTAINSNTSLTVSSNWSNTASGQTATRRNSALVAREAGLYMYMAYIKFAFSATGIRSISAIKNTTGSSASSSLINLTQEATEATDGNGVVVSQVVRLAQWDWIEMQAWQDSGGALNLQGSSSGMPGTTTKRCTFQMCKIGN